MPIVRTNEEQLAILKQGVEVWNKWRAENPDVQTDLSRVDLSSMSLNNVNFGNTQLNETILVNARLNKAYLRGADLFYAQLNGADLTSADLTGANLSGAVFTEANLTDANFVGADLFEAYFLKANLTRAQLHDANLSNLFLREAILYEANLEHADLSGTDLSGADLTRANLERANLIRTKIDKAKVSRSSVYAINVWDLEGKFEDQKDLIISPFSDPRYGFSVDNLKIAQFIYLILNNEEIRDVINTLTSKSVLILGRFALPERKAILDALRNKLREYDLLPIVFDFDRPTDKDFTETIKTLAGLSYFVIADVTNPKSSPLELQATVPDYQIPFVPIIQEGEQPFAMMSNLQTKYNWVLDTLSYSSIDTLLKALKPAIIDPAIQKHNELRLIKAREPKIRSAEDFIDKS